MIHEKPKGKRAKPKGPWLAATNLYYDDGHEIPAGDPVKGKRLEKSLIESGKVIPADG